MEEEAFQSSVPVHRVSGFHLRHEKRSNINDVPMASKVAGFMVSGVQKFKAAVPEA